MVTQAGSALLAAEPAHGPLALVAAQRLGRGSGPPTHAVLVTDGTALESCREALARSGAEQAPVYVAALAHARELAAGSLGHVVDLGAQAASPSETIDALERLAREPTALAHVEAARNPKALLLVSSSHDEASLGPAVRSATRGAGLALDRVVEGLGAPVGSAELRARAAAAQAVVVVLSKATVRSSVGAFAAGLGVALGLPVRVIAYEPVPTPAWASGLPWRDLEALAMERPWLDFGQLVVACLLEAG